MDLKKASVNQLIEELSERSRFMAVAAATNDNDMFVVTRGENGMEILGAITMMLQSHMDSVRGKLFRSEYDRDDD